MAEWRINELSGVLCKSCGSAIDRGVEFALVTSVRKPHCVDCCSRMGIAVDDNAIADARRRLMAATRASALPSTALEERGFSSISQLADMLRRRMKV